MNDTGSRPRFVRKRWHLTPDALADRSGVDVGMIRQTESGDGEPDRLTVWKLSEALCVRPEWIQDGSGEMLDLWHMTQGAQIQAQSGPGTEGLPGFVVVEGGPWYQDERGVWQVERKEGER